MPIFNSRVRLITLLVAAASISGCIRSLVWSDANFSGTDLRIKRAEGALNVNGERPPIQSRCGPDLNAVGTSCAYAFIDSRGDKVDILQLVQRLDRRAEQVPELKQWVGRGNRNYRPDSFPYKLHLLTVSPAIVLAVPRTDGTPAGLCWTLLFEGCAQSHAFSGNGYWFRESPRVVPGSFWFSLDSRGTNELVGGQKEVEISHEGALLRLSDGGETWRVVRVQ